MKSEIRGLKVGKYSAEDCSLEVFVDDEGFHFLSEDFDLGMIYHWTITPENKTTLEVVDTEEIMIDDYDDEQFE